MPDYMFQLESRLSPEQRAAMVRIQELATESESNLYLVGGAVRDVVSGMSIRDLDFTIEGNPARMIRELEKGGAKVAREDESLRTAELLLSGEVDASISAAREDIYARPGAKPETRFSTIMEDLRRRDFSVNAIAISLNPNSRGLLLDPTNGLADLERREIRALSIHRTSLYVFCGRCDMSPEWVSRWSLERRNGSTWHSSENCKRPSQTRTPAESSAK
jgi:tRNA nucleotidyltransferase (CCA-adding enzyme)